MGRLPAAHPPRTVPGVLITPHVAGGSAAFEPRADRFVAAQVRCYAASEPLQNAYGRG